MNPLRSLLTWAIGKTAFSQAFLRGDDVGDLGGGSTSGLGGASSAYRRSVWVRAAIELLSGPIKSVPLRFAADARGSQTLINDPRLAEFWANPAQAPVRAYLPAGLKPGQMPLAEVIEATVGWLKLNGEVFWVLDDTWLVTRSSVRSPFLIARPDRMHEVRQGAGLVGWRYTDGGGRAWDLLPEQVLQLKRWNPVDDFRGLGPYEAARVAAEADYLAGLYGRNLMRNNGDRGPIISAKGGMLSDQQQEQIIRMLREKRAAAQRGEFRPAFLSGEVTVEDPKAQALDAAMVAQRIENRDEIAVAMGVPPSMFHVAASYSIGSASDYFRLIETGCMPVAAQIADAIEALSRILVGRQVYAWFDFTQHSTMQQVRSERIEKDARALFAMGVPFRTINESLGLGLPRHDGDETGFLPLNVQRVDEALASHDLTLAPEMPAAPAPAPAKSFDRLERLLDPLARLEQRMIAEPAIVMGARTLPGSTSKASRVQRWQAHFVRQKACEKRMLSKIRRVLMAARSESLRRITAQKTIETRAAAADFLFDPERFGSAMIAELRKVQRPALDEAGQEVFDELKMVDPFTMPEPAALDYLAIRENKIKGASDNVYQQLKNSLEDGLHAGETLDQLAERVRSVFGAIDKGHALTIAATETGAAFGVGRQRAFEVAGVEWKEWLTSGLPNVRATHETADGLTVPTDEPFTVGGAALMHPGDPTGPAEEVINCRCVAIASQPPEGSNP